uniref:DM2 domain-containing protein n=1 Tax=viral metagenome TaxID=1070528 RepID=A0A6C0APL4_9ZZZZ
MKSGPKIDSKHLFTMRIPAMNASTASSIMNTPSTPAKTQKSVSKKTAPSVASVAAPVVVAPVVAAPEAAAPKAKASKKAAAPETAVTAAPVVAVNTVEAAPVEAADAAVTSVQDDVKAMLTHANTLRETAAALVAELKRVDKRVARLQKEADKRRRRVKKPVEGEPVVPRKPSIFELPTPLSNELCSFLGRASGSKESRSNITKAITTYVKEKNLKEKHTIKPDAKLKALLGVAEGDVLTYFNLQRYLNRHYLKPAAAVPSA